MPQAKVKNDDKHKEGKHKDKTQICNKVQGENRKPKCRLWKKFFIKREREREQRYFYKSLRFCKHYLVCFVKYPYLSFLIFKTVLTLKRTL